MLLRLPVSNPIFDYSIDDKGIVFPYSVGQALVKGDGYIQQIFDVLNEFSPSKQIQAADSSITQSDICETSFVQMDASHHIITQQHHQQLIHISDNVLSLLHRHNLTSNHLYNVMTMIKHGTIDTYEMVSGMLHNLHLFNFDASGEQIQFSDNVVEELMKRGGHIEQIYDVLNELPLDSLFIEDAPAANELNWLHDAALAMDDIFHTMTQLNE